MEWGKEFLTSFIVWGCFVYTIRMVIFSDCSYIIQHKICDNDWVLTKNNFFIEVANKVQLWYTKLHLEKAVYWQTTEKENLWQKIKLM